MPGCPLQVEGVSNSKTAHVPRRRGRLGNAAYNVATITTSLSPVKTGALTISALDMNVALQLPVGTRRRDVFDPFGMFQQDQERQVTLSAAPETLTALPLPRENIPTNFIGAVGSFSMTVSAGPTNVATGDPITVKVQISGHGAFDSLALPEQNAWRDFKTYPPTTKVETTDALGLQGAKTFEQVVVPQSADIKALPPVSFSFFDPDQKSYRTLTQPAVPLVVRRAARRRRQPCWPPAALRPTTRLRRKTSFISNRVSARWPGSDCRWRNSPGSSRFKPSPRWFGCRRWPGASALRTWQTTPASAASGRSRKSSATA